MKKSEINTIVVYSLALVCILSCTNPPHEESMQPYAGYPLLANPDSISQELASNCLDTINFNARKKQRAFGYLISYGNFPP